MQQQTEMERDVEMTAGDVMMNASASSSIECQVMPPPPPPADEYDAMLAADFITDLPLASSTLKSGGGDNTIARSPPGAHPYAFVHGMVQHMATIAACGTRTFNIYKQSQLPLVACMHFIDTMLDIGVLVYLASDASAGSSTLRSAAFIAGVIFMALPILVQCASDVIHATQNRHNGEVGDSSHPPFSPSSPPISHDRPTLLSTLSLLMLNILHCRSFYESFNLHRLHNRARRGDAPKHAHYFVYVSRSLESTELHMQHLMRICLHAMPMAIMQSYVVLQRYEDSTPSYPPIHDAWQHLSIVSLSSSILCISVTAYRLCCCDAVWRRKAGTVGLLALWLFLLAHPIAHVAAWVLIAHSLTLGWLLVSLFVGIMVNGLLNALADWLSPHRRVGVQSWFGVARCMTVLAPMEMMSGGVAIQDLTHATSKPPETAPGSAKKWMMEYAGVMLCHLATLIVAIYCFMAHGGGTWTHPALIMIYVSVATRIGSLALLLPRIDT